MARFLHPQVVTANALLSGDAVYFTANENWSAELGEAAIADSPDAARDLLAAATAQVSEIVGAYLADVQLDEAGIPHPVHVREAIRTRGPSNYFHGKQAQV